VLPKKRWASIKFEEKRVKVRIGPALPVDILGACLMIPVL